MIPMPEGLDKLADAIGDTLKTAPTLYEDALQPTIQEAGKFVARIPRAINAAFSGLDKWILNKEYAIDETKKLLEKKLENVDPDKIVEPEAYVAVPAIQAISYSMNSEELRNLYANLLAKAMNSDTKDQVHPSFVEIIKQMSPTDALLLKEIALTKSFPIVNLSVNKYTSSDFSAIQKMNGAIQNYTYPNVTYISFASYESVLVSLDNLLRLKLTEERFSFNNKDIPQKIQNTASYINYKKELQNLMSGDNWEYEETIHFFILSFLGMNFCNICL